jgi:hypothetical protein
MDLVEEIRNAAVRNLSHEKFVVEVLISGKKIPKRVLVIIDVDTGVTIDHCADLSRKLSKEFEDRSFFWRRKLRFGGLHPRPRSTAQITAAVSKKYRAQPEGEISG